MKSRSLLIHEVRATLKACIKNWFYQPSVTWPFFSNDAIKLKSKYTWLLPEKKNFKKHFKLLNYHNCACSKAIMADRTINLITYWSRNNALYIQILRYTDYDSKRALLSQKVAASNPALTIWGTFGSIQLHWTTSFFHKHFNGTLCKCTAVLFYHRFKIHKFQQDTIYKMLLQIAIKIK